MTKNLRLDIPEFYGKTKYYCSKTKQNQKKEKKDLEEGGREKGRGEGGKEGKKEGTKGRRKEGRKDIMTPNDFLLYS